MPYGYGSRGNSRSSNRERGADRNRNQSTSRSTSKSTSKSTSNTNNRERGADRNRSQTILSSVRNRNTTSLNIAKQEKDAEAFKDYSYQKPSGLGRFSPLAQFLDITGIGKKTFELNKSYYEKNVIGKINPATGKAYSANINEYQNYIKGRNAGTIDAMGRRIAQRRDDRRIVTQVQKAAVAQAPSGPTTSEVSQSTSAYGGELTDEQQALRVKKRGRKQTILTQSTGLGGSEPLITKKKLLG